MTCLGMAARTAGMPCAATMHARGMQAIMDMLHHVLCMQDAWSNAGGSPSPRSLACSTRQTVLNTTTMVSVQNTSDMAPSTCSGLGSALKTLGKTYSGEVPACNLSCVSLPFSSAWQQE